jgi:hypothetical protein
LFYITGQGLAALSLHICLEAYTNIEKEKHNIISMEEHILDTNAGKQLSLSSHRSLINTGIEKMNNIQI